VQRPWTYYHSGIIRLLQWATFITNYKGKIARER